MSVLRWSVGILLTLLIMVTPQAVLGQTDIINYRKALEDVLDRWNKKEPEDRAKLREALIPALSSRVKTPVTGYEDEDWVREILVKIDKDVPERITPKLPVAEEARKQYIDYMERYRLPFYLRQDIRARFPRLEPREDLQPKVYFLLSIAEREAGTDRETEIRFRHLRRAFFFWFTGLFPVC